MLRGATGPSRPAGADGADGFSYPIDGGTASSVYAGLVPVDFGSLHRFTLAFFLISEGLPHGNSIQLRRDSAANWTSSTLGGLGFETARLSMKVGDGATAWSASLAVLDGLWNGDMVLAPFKPSPARRRSGPLALLGSWQSRVHIRLHDH